MWNVFLNHCAIQQKFKDEFCALNECHTKIVYYKNKH